MRGLFGLLVGVAALVAGCRSFPEIAAGECGNHVVEAGEDCDGFGRDGFTCLPQDSVGACHLHCAVVAPGEGLACPAGFGCDVNDVCRRGTGEFVPHPNVVAGDYESLLTGDFDGDGRADIIGLGVQDSLGQRHFDVTYFDASANPTNRWTTTNLLANEVVTKLAAGDQRASLLASGSAFGVMLGEPDQTLSPDVHPSYYAPESKVRVVSIWHEQVDHTSPLLVLAQAPGGPVVLAYPTVTNQELLHQIGEVDGDFASLAATAVHLFEGDENPCDELVVAPVGESRVTVYQACFTDAGSGALRFREEASALPLWVPSDVAVSSAPLGADVDGDGHEDLVIPTDHGAYVAAGDGHALAAPVPLALPLLDPRDGSLRDPSYAGPLLAAGDFSGDGQADFVTPRGFLLSTSGPAPGELAYLDAPVAGGQPWSEAVIADFTGDGLLDVLAASDQHADMDLATGTGTARPGTLVIPTTRPVRHLAPGDYDGDQVLDVAFTELSAAPGGEDEFLVAFGGDFTTLGSPVPAGHVAAITGLTALADNEFDIRADLVVNHWLLDRDGIPGSALSFAEGDAHRQFIVPIQLSDTKIEGAVNRGEVLSLAAGHFRSPDRTDAMVIGMSWPVTDESPLQWDLWYLPELVDRTSTLRRLGWGFDPAIAPCDYRPGLLDHTTARARLVAADLDGDGLDEAVVAAPTLDGERCLIQSASVDADHGTVAPSEALVLEEPCVVRPSLVVKDLDGDGLRDLVLLTGGPGATGRLLVAWNQGGGHFATDHLDTLVASATAPRAFTSYVNEGTPSASLAYATDDAVHLLAFRSADRRFSDTVVATLAGSTGIAAGDVNGDGLADLVVAAGGNITILAAGLAE